MSTIHELVEQIDDIYEHSTEDEDRNTFVFSLIRDGDDWSLSREVIESPAGNFTNITSEQLKRLTPNVNGIVICLDSYVYPEWLEEAMYSIWSNQAWYEYSTRVFAGAHPEHEDAACYLVVTDDKQKIFAGRRRDKELVFIDPDGAKIKALGGRPFRIACEILGIEDLSDSDY